MGEPGKIIVLNGASSSGKTSILHALQDLLDEPYLEAGVDKFIFMLPPRYLERPLWDSVLGLATTAGVAGHRLFSGMHHAVAELARSGNNVLVDHVLVEPAWVQECAGLFSGLPAYLVGVHCPLDVLEQREAARRNRTPGQARAQFALVHSYCVYDMFVDTSQFSTQECAVKIKERLENGVPPHAFELLGLKRP
jgi:chloramphenicol 3-O phosphotransferase